MKQIIKYKNQELELNLTFSTMRKYFETTQRDLALDVQQVINSISQKEGVTTLIPFQTVDIILTFLKVALTNPSLYPQELENGEFELIDLDIQKLLTDLLPILMRVIGIDIDKLTPESDTPTKKK